jgi:hypothetical protein
MTVEELRRKFIVDVDAVRSRLEPVVAKAMAHCQISQDGQVLISNPNLSTRDQVALVLVARTIASELDPSISPDVTVGEIAKYLNLPRNQIRARAGEVVRAKVAHASKPGKYRATPHRVEAFLDSLDYDERRDQ